MIFLEVLQRERTPLFRKEKSPKKASESGRNSKGPPTAHLLDRFLFESGWVDGWIVLNQSPRF